MQKVTKERLAMFRPSKLQKPETEDLNNVTFLHYLLQVRENARFMELGMKLQKAGKEGMFDTWMYEESDLIQGAAWAYGERLISEQVTNTYDKADPSIKPVLGLIRHLYLINIIEKDLGWFLTNKALSLETGTAVSSLSQYLCRQLAPHAMSLVASFKIPDAMLSAPIALDWVKYNDYDNQGEV